MTSGGTPRSELGRFALGVGAVLIPSLVAWWLAVDVIVEALRPVTAWLAHLLMPVNAITPDTGHGWIVQTGIEVVAGKTIAGAELATFAVPTVFLRQMTATWPLFLAFMLAPPRPLRLLGALLAGFLALAVLFALSACAMTFLQFAALADHVPAWSGDAPPPFQIAWPAYSDATFLLVRLVNQACNFLPLFSPPVLWLWLNPAARQAFLGWSRRPGRAPSNPIRKM